MFEKFVRFVLEKQILTEKKYLYKREEKPTLYFVRNNVQNKLKIFLGIMMRIFRINSIYNERMIHKNKFQ